MCFEANRGRFSRVRAAGGSSCYARVQQSCAPTTINRVDWKLHTREQFHDTTGVFNVIRGDLAIKFHRRAHVGVTHEFFHKMHRKVIGPVLPARFSEGMNRQWCGCLDARFLGVESNRTDDVVDHVAVEPGLPIGSTYVPVFAY